MLQQFDERNRDLIVNIGGELVHRDEAGVSPFDSLVQGGDGVWEGLRLYDGKIYALSLKNFSTGESLPRPPIVRDWGPRKIEGETARVHNQLHHVRIEEFFLRLNALRRSFLRLGLNLRLDRNLVLHGLACTCTATHRA